MLKINKCLAILWVSDVTRCEVKIEFLFCVFMDLDEVEVHKLAKKKRGQYSAILTEQAWSRKDLVYGFWFFFFFGG